MDVTTDRVNMDVANSQIKEEKAESPDLTGDGEVPDTSEYT